MPANLIEILNVHKKFKNTYAVRGVDFFIKQGEFVGLLGPNGAGKTTLIEMIEGIQLPDSGTIKISNKSWKGNEEELHKFIGIALQETKFIDKLSVLETLTLFSSFYSLNQDRVKEILLLINLEEKKSTNTIHLSGGQRQRLALGIALLHQPKVLLLDEPTTGLDPSARREIWEILDTLKREKGISMILTTHYMEEASFLCDRICIMDYGQFIAEGTIESLIDKYSHGDLIDFSLDKPLPTFLDKEFEGLAGVNWEIPFQKGTLIVTSITKVLPQFLNYLSSLKINPLNIECRRMTLEDLFIQLTGRKLKDD